MLATDVVRAVGPGRNFLSEPHTVRHFRHSLWLPGTVWARQGYDEWLGDGGRSFADRLTGSSLRPLRPEFGLQ